MRIYLGCDHAGLELKQHVAARLADQGHDLVDCGALSYDAEDDYPIYVLRAAERVAREPGSFGVVLGGSGNGEVMAANKVAGVRAALAWNTETARLAREHNDANVISLGARRHGLDEAAGFVETFLATSFSAGQRHIRRIDMLTRYEESGELPPLPEAH